MNKSAWIWVAAGCAAGTILTMGIASQGHADQETCQAKTFHTVIVYNACASGGQPAAKVVMKDFMQQKRIASCLSCHTKLGPTYELKSDGLEQFRAVGGNLLRPLITVSDPSFTPGQPLTPPPGAGKVIGAPVGGAAGH